MVSTGQPSRQHNVTIQHTPGIVRHRIVHIVGFYQNCIESGYTTCWQGSGTFHQAAEFEPDAGRIPSWPELFAGGDADFAQGHTVSGDRIHQKVHCQALISEIFGGCRGKTGRVHLFHGAAIAGGHKNHASGQTFFAQITFDEFPDFSTPFSHKTYNVDVGPGVSGQHTQERGFTHPGTREYTNPLPASYGEYRINGPNTGGQGLMDGKALCRTWRIAIRMEDVSRKHRRSIVQRPTETIQYPTQHFVAHMDGHSLAGGMYHGIRKNARCGTQSHQNQIMPAEAGNLGHDGCAVGRLYLADLSYGCVWRARRENGLAAHLNHLAQGTHGIHLIQDRIVFVQHQQMIFS